MKTLPSKLRKGLFTSSDATEAGISYRQLQKLLAKGEVEQMARGLYRAGGGEFSEEDSFVAATARLGIPSAVCLVSALAHYHLTDLIPRKTWVMVEAHKRTQHRDIRTLRTRNPQWEIGIEKRSGYWITTIERTLVDALIYRSLVGTSAAIESLRRATREKKTSLGRVMEMGKKLGVAHRIRPYIEALA